MPARDQAQIHSSLRRTEVFGDLPDEDLRGLAGAARVEHCKRPTLLNAAGQPLAHLRLVLQGYVEIVARRASGDEVAFGEIGPGGWATWLGCFVPRPPEHDFYSSADSRFVALPTGVVRALALRRPELFPRVIADIGVRMRQLMEWAGDSVLLAPPQRMAKLIHLLARTHGAARDGAVVPVTQSRLARMARCSRQSANALVRALQERGLITVRYGRFEIPDLARLVEFIEADPLAHPERSTK
jgi:CRP-like cAMP-binding protein